MMWKKLILLVLILTLSLILIFSISKKRNSKLAEMMPVPEFSLIDEKGQLISEKDLKGKVFVVEFFFTNCPTICPVMNQNLREVVQEIDDTDFAIVSITIDPKRDTSEVLSEHKRKLGIINPNWHFLTGNRDDIYRLSEKFNIYVGKDENTAEGLNHSGKIALIDKNGNLRCRFREDGAPLLYYSGLNYTDEEGKNMSLGGTYHPEIENLKQDIKKLLNEN